MTWLSGLSLARAIRWALVWPALLVVLCIAAVLVVLRGRDEWAIGWNFQPPGGLGVWSTLFLSALLFLCGPPAVFLVLWRVAKR